MQQRSCAGRVIPQTTLLACLLATERMCHTRWRQAEHAFDQADSSACYVVYFGLLRRHCAVGFDLNARTKLQRRSSKCLMNKAASLPQTTVLFCLALFCICISYSRNSAENLPSQCLDLASCLPPIVAISVRRYSRLPMNSGQSTSVDISCLAATHGHHARIIDVACRSQ